MASKASDVFQKGDALGNICSGHCVVRASWAIVPINSTNDKILTMAAHILLMIMVAFRADLFELLGPLLIDENQIEKCSSIIQ